MKLNIKNYYKSLIYPQGKIHTQYLSFIKWSFATNYIISIQTILGTHSMLSSVCEQKTELTVTVNYISKDILGQIGGILLINKYSKKIDKNTNNFIKYNIMPIQQLSIFTECITPILPNNYFIPIASLANVGKNITFTGFAAINAIIIQKLSIDKDNIGEIYSKLTIVNTISTTLGMSTGLLIAGLIPDHHLRLLIMPILYLLRYYTYKKSIEGLI